MAFATNSSAFGIKPATGSLFGNTQPQQQQNPTNSFQNAAPLGQNQQQGPSLFGGFGQQSQQQPSGGLFGQTQQQGQQQQTLPAGSLFGQPQQQQQAQPSTSLFGQQQQPQQQQQQQQPQTSLFGGSLFGGNTNANIQQQPQQQQQQQQQQQNPFGGGTFGGFGGNNQQQQQQPQQQQAGLFGSTLGGNNPLQAQATLPSFGNTTGGPGGFGGFGGGSTLFGQKSQQPQQQQNNFGQTQNFNAPTQPSGPPPFTKSTKFNDLPDNVKKTLENIESYIQGRVQICKDLQQRKLGDEPTKGNEAIRNLHKELVDTATLIRNDLHLTEDIKGKVDQAVEDTIVATRIIDGFRNPQSGNTFLKDHATFPLEYFTRVADQMRERLVWYKTTIEQIERKLASASNSAQAPQSISATLQAQHASFLALASKTAAVDAELQKIKGLYTQLWRSKTGSVRDPFNDVAKPVESVGDFGLSGLTVR